MEENKTKQIYPLRYQSNLSEKGDSNAAVYFEHLDQIMAMEELHNIAVTGNRGAGKSSILHSYDNARHRSGEKFLYISLAEFENYIEEAVQEEAAQEKKEEVSADSQPPVSAPATEPPSGKETAEEDAERENEGSAVQEPAGTESPPAEGAGEKEPEQETPAGSAVQEPVGTESPPAEEDGEKEPEQETPAGSAVQEPAGTESPPAEEDGEKEPEQETPPRSEEKVKELDPVRRPRQLSQKGRERIQKRLEYSLICQILARCTKEDLRSSSLKAITEMRESRRWVKVRYAYVLILALLVCVLRYDEQFDMLQWMASEYEKVPYEWIHMGLYVITALMTLGLGAYLFSRKPGFFQLRKINLKTPTVETEVGPSEEVYCLDKYRFDLVYILNQIADKIGYTVVIEDLELVGDCCAEVIVSKLRELNLMINTHRREQYRNGESFLSRLHRGFRNWWSRFTDRKKAEDDHQSDETRMKGVKKCAKPVRFVYAISDETFDEEERTKFFDTILPLTPALNAKNAYEQLKNCFVGDAGMSAPKADAFISKLSKAVTDYRMLNDIMTEYHFFSRWHEKNADTPERDEEEKKDVPASVPKDWSERYGMRGRIFSRAAKRTVDVVNKEKPKEKEMTDEEKEKKEKKWKVARSLIAIATYKALLPYEYHYAYTPNGGGQLINPVRERIKGQSYRESTVECVKFLFDEGYLDAEVLTLIGFSREVLKLQWADILTNGDAIQQLDLLYRFDPANASRDGEEHEDLFSEVVRKKASEGVLDKAKKEELVKKLGERIFPLPDDAVTGLFAKLYDDDLTPDGLLNLLICLGRFDDEEIIDALKSVNEGPDHDLHLNEFQNRLQKCMNKTSFKLRLRDDDFHGKMVGTETEPSRCQQVVNLVLKRETNLSKTKKAFNAITA